MCREIKFRAWDEADGLYRDVGSFSYYDVHDSIGDVDSISQYTGLWDFNGVDIYENDFVSHDSVHHEMLVSFRDSKWVLVQRPSCESELEGECLCDNLCDFDNNELTVVGNIHANTEMLG